MRKVYSDEEARLIGYQKYWPEWQDWALGIFGCLAFCGVFVGVLLIILHATGRV